MKMSFCPRQFKISQVFRTVGLVVLLLLIGINSTSNHAGKEQLRRKLIFHDAYGTIKLDYYRTYKIKTFLFFFRWKSYSISKAGIRSQLAGLNFWFSGRVKFVLGDVFDYDDSPHENANAALELQSFADPNLRNLGRISVLVVKSFDDNTNGRAFIDVPLGGGTLSNFDEVAPVLTIKSAGSFPTVLENIGFDVAHHAGGILAHEVGHVLGFQHTSFPGFDTVWGYSECGLDLRYPLFGEDDKVRDALTGDVYHHDDWKGRANLMTRFGTAGVLEAVVNLELGMYKFNYEPIFDQITQCWFERSSSFAG